METNAKPKTLKLDDIYFVLFRHKWMILAFTVAALVGSALVWKMSTKLYTSEARLLVRYIVESGAVLPPGSEEQVRQIDLRGDSILNTEMEILRSANLAAEVAEVVGPERIIGEQAHPNAEALATRVVSYGVSVGLAGRSSVIGVAFTHSDPEVTREVLDELIRGYLKKHQEIHESGNTYDALAKKTDEMRLRLRETEEVLQRLREEIGSVSLKDAQTSLATEMESLRQDIREVESELAVRQAIASQNEKSGSAPDSQALSGASGTNDAGSMSLGTPSPLLSFRAMQDRLYRLRSREQEYLSSFTEENPMVRSVREQISHLESQMASMMAEYPQLAIRSEAMRVAAGTVQSLAQEESAEGLKARLMVYTNQLNKARAESVRLSELEKRVSEVELNRDIQRENWRYAATSLEQARYGSALELGKNSNINLIQEPTPPVLDTEPLMRRAGLVLAGLTGCGLILAFLIELFLDPRIKRRSQLDRETKLPVYVSIPRHSRKSLARAATGTSGQGAALVKRNGKSSQLYYEALRDRLIVFFERINLRRKPKLVGITACHGGAGVSTVAEGLAETLSETGGGKVLLVDLNQGQQAVHSYQSGLPMGALPEVLESAETSPTGSSGDALYLASFGRANSGNSHPTRSREFDQLIPKLKASDFDYIVFDMPPLTPTSVTFRVSGFLDKLIFVTESERTHLDSLKQAVKLLDETSARVALVMNKTREYMPGWLRPPQ